MPFAAHRSAPCRESTLRTRTAGFHHLGLEHAQLQSERGSLDIVQLLLEQTVANPCESDPPFDLWHNFSAFVDKTAQIQKLRCLWPGAAMTSGEVQGAWSGVRGSMVSVFLSDTVRPAALKTVTMTVIILARPSADFNKNFFIIGVQHTPNFPLYTC